MTFEQMKQRFQSIRTVTVAKQNKLGLFIGLILLPTFLIIAGMFFTMNIAGVSVEVNGIEYYPGSAQYESFYTVGIAVSGAILLATLVVIVLSTFQKPKFAYAVGIDEGQDAFVYAETAKEAKWVGPTKAIVWNRKDDRCVVTNDPVMIQSEREQIAFWTLERAPDKFRIKENGNGFTIKYAIYRYGRSQTRSLRVYESPEGKILGYREMVWDSYGGNSNLQVYAKYTFENVNRNVRPAMPEKLKREIYRYE
jgi:hypothetical protein